MDVFKQARAHVAFPALLAIALSSCGVSDEPSRTRESVQPSTEITAAIGTEVSGKNPVEAAASMDYATMSFCVLDEKLICKDPAVAMKFSRTVGSRKIFSLPEPMALVTKSVWKFVAIHSNGIKVDQTVKLTNLKDSSTGAVPPTGKYNWKVLLMASDQGNMGKWIDVFDNARKKIKEILLSKSIPAGNFRELSLHDDQQSETVKPTNAQDFLDSMRSFGTPAAGDACIVHMTSHGSKDGFNLGSNRLSPAQLGQALDEGCGEKPTVVLISACFSGLYVLDKSNLKKPNRIILTAARSDLTSFGCSAELQYTFWDSCLIESLPTSTKWKDLAKTIETCISRKESGMTAASFPQTFIGSEVTELEIPR